MKTFFVAVGLFGLLVLAAPNIRAQVYAPYDSRYADIQYQQYLQYEQYLQWQQYLEYLRQNDPYYDLHVVHYQLFLQPYQPYLVYPPCCHAGGIPRLFAPMRQWPHVGRGRAPRSVGRR
jgi:hypothetical protein